MRKVRHRSSESGKMISPEEFAKADRNTTTTETAKRGPQSLEASAKAIKYILKRFKIVTDGIDNDGVPFEVTGVDIDTENKRILLTFDDE